ncbi:PDZ domain-containing protein [Aquibacillus salsiterrae]|uniref:PDZ domain-containing protein n=1 Tax=Aquibacillus salsiterrae TaxID=2950439 RepID=A0A9X3WDK9_9BACI|nr:PDZ domain-containing protein [Aquibacillus salsiterrae]MDC3416145.1 PDZ domain-containing protein [Aquibacillus salsiterrae]
MEAWLLEIAKGIGKFFLHPLVYWFLIVTFLATYARIKRERRSFGSKVYPFFAEASQTLVLSLCAGVVLSLLAIGLGVVFSFPVLLLMTVITVLVTVTGRFSWLSAAYTMGFTYLLLFLLPTLPAGTLPTGWQEAFKRVNVISFTGILGLLIIIEAILMLQLKRRNTFPELVKGSRGKWIGQHRIKKIAMIPFFTLIPVGGIVPFASWWPIFPVGGESFGILLLPILIGFEHVSKGTAPLKASRRLGQSLLILGFLTTGIAMAGYYFPILTLVSVAVAIIGREMISYQFKWKDGQKQPFFSPDEAGLLVLDVMSGTPGERLGLMPGERIIKANGQVVINEQQFYEALQINSTYCKLDIRDERGELRFAQRALYQGEHHELGIIFVEANYFKKNHISKGRKKAE